jgi:hypothetical protein
MTRGQPGRWTKRLAIGTVASLLVYLIASLAIAARQLSSLRLEGFRDAGAWWG